MSQIICALSLVFALLHPYGAFAQGSNSTPANQVAGITPTEAVGTTVTAHNWQRYRDYMPDGMIALFEGKYF